MSSLTQPRDVTSLFAALALLLAGAKLVGEVVRKLDQPAVLGEIMAGILLGPTVFGALAPRAYNFVFNQGSVPLVLDGVTTIGVVLFLLTAGIEVDLSSVFRQGRAALLVSSLGVLFPFALGFAAADLFPRFLGAEVGSDRTIFALFVGTALSISALPVIAKILIDLKLFRTDLGVVVVSSAMFNDLVGWMLFSLVLGLMQSDSHSLRGIRHTILLVLAFVAVVLTLGRWLIHKALPWIQANASWPGGVLGFIFTLTLASAAFTEWAGIHAIFGAFIMGIAIGESSHLRKRTREHIYQIVTNVFAPLFFASIGLRTNFVKNFNLGVVCTVLAVACVGKIVGAGWGARLGGMDQRTALSVGVAMNARGAMEMILGILALQSGLIRDRMFVALVLMSLLTSLISAPLIHFIMDRKRTFSLRDLLSNKLFVPNLMARNKFEAVRELCEAAAPIIGNSADRLFRLVWARERVVTSGLDRGVAIPHGSVPGLAKPVIAVGVSENGIDFDARDGKLAHIVMLIVTGDSQSQFDLLSDATNLLSRQSTIERMLNAKNFVEFAAALNAPVN
jgi:Kef-type K+ transport system membrane component KefB/mannitol/fructose-specific phosphotransferase system IIA component (Ntr-type)